MAKISTASREAFWRQALAQQRSSGLSIHQFCVKEGLAAATLFVWKRRLRLAEDRGVGPAPAVGFAPVRVVAEPAVAAGVLEILLPRERRVRISGAVEVGQLRAVLAAMEA